MGLSETGEAGGGVLRGGCGLPAAFNAGARPGVARLSADADVAGLRPGPAGGPGGEGSASDRHRGRGGGIAGSGPDPSVIAEA